MSLHILLLTTIAFVLIITWLAGMEAKAFINKKLEEIQNVTKNLATKSEFELTQSQVQRLDDRINLLRPEFYNAIEDSQTQIFVESAKETGIVAGKIRCLRDDLCLSIDNSDEAYKRLLTEIEATKEELERSIKDQSINLMTAISNLEGVLSLRIDEVEVDSSAVSELEAVKKDLEDWVEKEMDDFNSRIERLEGDRLSIMVHLGEFLDEMRRDS